MVNDRLSQMYLNQPSVLHDIWAAAHRDLSPERHARLPKPPVPRPSPEDIRFIEDVRYAEYITS